MWKAGLFPAFFVVLLGEIFVDIFYLFDILDDKKMERLSESGTMCP